MRKKFFVKNLLLFVFPLLIPVLVLGSYSISISQKNVQAEIHKNNLNLFHQMERNVELIFNEIEFLGVGLGDVGVMYRIEEILRTQTMNLENLLLMENTKNYIMAPANARPYVQSVYVYIPNANDQFLTSANGLTNFQEFYDVGWRTSFLANQDRRDIWIEPRQIRRYSFEKPVPVTTVYKNLRSSGFAKPYGVIVLNINTGYFENQLRQIETYADQFILVLDGNDSLVFANRAANELAELRFGDIPRSAAAFRVEFRGKTYLGAQMASLRSDWRYVSVVPDDALSADPSRLTAVTFFLVAISFLLGLALAYFLTRRNVHHIRSMITLIKSAERNLPLPAYSFSGKEDEYEFIIQRLLENYIGQKNMQLEIAENKYRLKAAELAALQHQINPHFLFNTLETIQWKVMSLAGRPNEATAMIESLSDLLRYSLEKGGRIVPLDQELQMTENYVRIMSARYRGRFAFHIECDDSDRVFGVIPFLLQPLVENSIYHGIKEADRVCAIKIKVEPRPELLEITVIDNGNGMTQERLHRVGEAMRSGREERDGSIGLANIYKRLELVYGRSGLLSIRSKAGRGTVVTARIPLRPNPEPASPD